MSAVKGRSKRATGEATKLLQGRVPEAVKKTADQAADETGISLSAYLEALVIADAQHRIVRVRDEEIYHQEALTA
ncbi:MAG: hypothetical protein L0H74_05935 [Brachybacterium sp.]|nr:hypothetical protein [Brachybacterium sp.]